MPQDWFIIRDGKETGPYSPVELKQMAATGRLNPNDLVRRGDMKAASKASTIKGLFATVEAVSTKPPSPSTSTEAAPPPAAQKNSVPAKKTLITVSVVGGACLLLCCGGLGLIGIFAPRKDAASKKLAEAETSKNKGGPDSTAEAADDVLSAKFLPCVAGNVKKYEEEVYDPVTGTSLVHTESQETCGKDNTITIDATMKSPGVPPSRISGERHIRISDGFLEKKEGKTGVWQRLYKLGAKPGDTWSDGMGTYTFVKFQKVNAQGAQGPYEVVQAVIERRLTGKSLEVVTEIVLERDGGIQSEKEYSISRGQKKLTRQKRLISSTN